eukprot:gene1852-993_t
MSLGTVLVTTQLTTSISSISVMPLSRIAAILQNRENSDLKKIIEEIIDKEGKLGLFKDIFFNTTLDIISDVSKLLFSGLFSAAFQWILPNKNQNNLTKNILIFGATTIFTKLITYPLEVVKYRRQNDLQNKYHGIIDCFKQTYKERGIIKFYDGYIEDVAYTLPNALVTYEIFDKLYMLASLKSLRINLHFYKFLTANSAALSHSISRFLFYPCVKYIKGKQISDKVQTPLYNGCLISMMKVFFASMISIYSYQIISNVSQ